MILAGLLAACGGDAATATPSPTAIVEAAPASAEIGGEVGDVAPEFTGISNWINSDALTMAELRGDVVLIDFWTYTCVNCIRTLPYIRQWQEKYADHGLVIVGVHTPEFDFEKVTENVVDSAGAFELTYPIAQDNDFGTWNAYSNRAWPAKYLVDMDGVVRYTHRGEGRYRETEGWIRTLLEERGADLSAVPTNDDPEPIFDPRAYAAEPGANITREIYGGWRRNATPGGIYIAHFEYYEAVDSIVEYEDTGDHQNQFLYLNGLWENGLESVRHARKTEGLEDYLALKFIATSVNAVFDPTGGSFEVDITLDGRPLTQKEAGQDLIIEGRRSYLSIDEPRLYAIVELPEYGTHELTLASNSDQFALFAFTFGAYAEGP